MVLVVVLLVFMKKLLTATLTSSTQRVGTVHVLTTTVLAARDFFSLAAEEVKLNILVAESLCIKLLLNLLAGFQRAAKCSQRF